MRAVAQRALEQTGYTVVAATRPEAAEAPFAHLEGRIDLLVTDVVMPGCTGVELYRRLAAYAPQLKVVYMSGYTDSRISGDEFVGKGVRFIQKPFDPRDLRGKCANCSTEWHMPDIRPARLLVVDDEPHMREIICRYLTTEGYHCAAAGNVQDAWEMLQQESFDAVLSDISMPGKSGMDLLAMIGRRCRTWPS